MAKLRRVYARQVQALEPVIGHDAARLAAIADKFPAGTLAGSLIFLPAALWAEFGGPQAVWAVAVLGAAVSLGCLFAGIRLGRESARIASAHVSRQLGYPVHLRANGWRPSRWEEDITRNQVT